MSEDSVKNPSRNPDDKDYTVLLRWVREQDMFVLWARGATPLEAAREAVTVALQENEYTEEEADAFQVLGVFPGEVEELLVMSTSMRPIDGNDVLLMCDKNPEE